VTANRGGESDTAVTTSAEHSLSRHKVLFGPGRTASRMLDADFEVCTECGNLHMEGGAAPSHVEECAVCGGRTDDVELDDIVGL
jgi:hypothetical protein